MSKHVIQAHVVDPTTFDQKKRAWSLALFKPDGTPFSLAGGEVGPQGPQGPEGPQGPLGPKGDPGNPGVQGPAGTNGAQGPSSYDVWLANGHSGTVNDYLASLVGAKGDRGDPGPAGAQGQVGPAGAQGPQGLAGSNQYKGLWIANQNPAFSPGDLVYYNGRLWVAPAIISPTVPPDQNPVAPVNKTLTPVEGGQSRNFPAIQAWTGGIITLQADGAIYSNPRYFDINPGGSVTVSKVAGTVMFVKLYDSNGNQIGAEGTDWPVTWTNLPAGRYFVAFFQASGGAWVSIGLSDGAARVLPAPWLPGYSQTVTSLPTSPQDGQEIFYVVDSSQGLVWHLKYRANSPQSLKWEFVGGSELYANKDANDTISAAGWANYGGPSIVVPLAGIYMLSHGGRLIADAGAGGHDVQQTVSINGAAPLDSPIEAYSAGSSSNAMNSSLTRIRNFAAGVTVSEVLSRDAGNAGANMRWMSLRPRIVG